jgi:hypothetical protein
METRLLADSINISVTNIQQREMCVCIRVIEHVAV